MSSMGKPRIFFGSSSEARTEMETLARLVTNDDWAIPRLWTLEFEAGANFLTSLIERSGNVEFAILLYTADDTIVSRGNTYHIARDNIIFEYGLFLSKLGPRYSILVAPKDHDLKFMSDIAAIQ
jgi:predicted nucleotide-binding protein